MWLAPIKLHRNSHHVASKLTPSLKMLQGYVLISTTRHLPGMAGVTAAIDWALKARINKNDGTKY